MAVDRPPNSAMLRRVFSKFGAVLIFFFGSASFATHDDLVGSAHSVGGKIGEEAGEIEALDEVCHNKAVTTRVSVPPRFKPQI